MDYNIPIFLSADNNYAPFVATTIASICDNTKSFCEFYVLDGGISRENQEKICDLRNCFSNFSIDFIKVDTEKYFFSFKEKLHFTKSMYSRFLIPDLISSIDRAIYSDVDVIVLGDIAEFYNENLEDYILGAVYCDINENKINPQRKKELEISNIHKYFSSGNLLIDCKKWRDTGITQKLFEIEIKYREKLVFADQDVLNKCFDTNYKQLSKKYCFLSGDFFVPYDGKIVIRHFEGVLKPWNIEENSKNINLPNLSDFWKYAKMTSFYDIMKEKTQDSELRNRMQRCFKVQQMIESNKCK